MKSKLILAILFAAVLTLGTAMAACTEQPACGPYCSPFGINPGYWDTDKGPLGAASCCTDATCTALCRAPPTGNGTNDRTVKQGDNVLVTLIIPTTGFTSPDPYGFNLTLDWNANGTCGVTSGATFFSGIWDPDGNGGQGSCTVPDIVPVTNDSRIDTQNGYVLLSGGPSSFNLTIGTGGAGSGYDSGTNATLNNTLNVVQNATSDPPTQIGIVQAAIYVNYTNGSNIWGYYSGGSPVNYNPDSGMPFAMQKGYDWYIGNSTSGNYFIKMNLTNVISNINLWDFSAGTVDRSYTDGLYKVFDNNLNLPSTLKKILLVPKGSSAYAYCCPDATSLADVNSTCNNAFNTTTEITGPSSVVYYACIGMTSSGGGSGPLGGGGAAAPEFSDIAYVLAAVLGAGGFVLIRKMRKF